MDHSSEARRTVGEGLSSPGKLPAHDLTGRVLGDFLVERMIGHGGMGEVYLARQVSLDRVVALKVLRPEWAANPTYMARFEAEAWAAAKLNHPNIVHIYTLGGLDGLRFIAMEYVPGTNLREYLTRKGTVELPLALSIMKQAGQALGAAAEAGLIHRDIKPDNLLLTRKGLVKVADFGLARLPEPERLHLTAPGMTLGTPMYMSPEQVEDRAVDHRSDLYSLGVTFYHMLAGSPPFRAETAMALALKHLREEPTSLAVHRPDLPADLVALVMKLMAKSPEGRYPSAGEMLKDLARVKERLQQGGGATLLSVVEVPTFRPPSPDASDLVAPGAVAERPVGGWLPGWRLILGLSAAGLVAGAVLGWMARAEDLAAPSAAPPSSPPALWLADWRAVPARPTAMAQYRYAQTRASGPERAAAWLAVPGRFPKEADWSWSAYLQLARQYLRQGDARRLEAMARELREAEARSSSARETWMGLARVIRAGGLALQGDAGEVIATFANHTNLAAMNPALAALALEVVGRASQGRPRGRGESAALLNLRNQLLGPLRIAPALFERIEGTSHQTRGPRPDSDPA